MKVGDLVEEAEGTIQIEREEKAVNIIKRKKLEIERTEKILKKMKDDLTEFLDQDVEDIDLCDSRY